MSIDTRNLSVSHPTRASAIRKARLSQSHDLRNRPLISITITVGLIIVAAQASGAQKHDTWTVEIQGGLAEAHRVASELGCRNLGLVTGFNDVYLFANAPQQPHRDHDVDPTSNEVLSSHRLRRQLESHPRILWADRQMPQVRVKRDSPGNSPVPGHPLAQPPLASLGAARVGLAGSPALPGQLGGAGVNVGSPQSSLGAPNPPALGVGSAALGSASVVANQASGQQGAQTEAAYKSSSFNDELWSQQWYLQDSANIAQSTNGIELNVRDVWKMGFYGHGIVVSILDDGLEWNHTDIAPNYDPRASWDMNNNRSDPFPRYDATDSNSHGTRCAGEISMVAHNRKCGVGVAPKARIGGIKCLDGEILDHIESMSLLHNIDYIDIYSGSWGPQDNGIVVDGPKRLASQALERGTRLGRQGKGVLYVWANGNGGHVGDNCNCDGYATSIYTISVGGVSQQGQLPFYGERCASTIAVTCSSGAYTDRKIVTTDLHNKCTVDYTGTSAAAPLAAGVYALVLEANRNLTWRDVQHLTAWTSNPMPIRDNPGWKRNGAGLVFNSRFGFGLLDAKAMVEAALSWRQVPPKHVCSVAPATRLPMMLRSRGQVQAVFVTDGCQAGGRLPVGAGAAGGLPVPVPGSNLKPMQAMSSNSARAMATSGSSHTHSQSSLAGPVNYLEHVQLYVDIEYTSRGALDVFLVSPSGTVSAMLNRRPLDVSRAGFDKWALMSVHFWGEQAQGKWSLIVRDKDGQHNRGLLRNATLVLHGTVARPAHMAAGRREYDGGDSMVARILDPISDFDEDDIYDLNTFPNDMALARDDSFQPTFIKSVIAMERMNQQRETDHLTMMSVNSLQSI